MVGWWASRLLFSNLFVDDILLLWWARKKGRKDGRRCEVPAAQLPTRVVLIIRTRVDKMIENLPPTVKF